MLISKTAGKEQGSAGGMNNAYMSLNNMIGPALAGVYFDWHMSIPLIWCDYLTGLFLSDLYFDQENC